MAYVANEIMEKFSLKPQPTDNFRYYSGEGADMLIKRCLIDAGDPDLVHYEEVRELYRKKFDEDPLYKVVPYKDMPETIQKLKDAGLKMAGWSVKDRGRIRSKTGRMHVYRRYKNGYADR